MLVKGPAVEVMCAGRGPGGDALSEAEDAACDAAEGAEQLRLEAEAKLLSDAGLSDFAARVGRGGQHAVHDGSK